ncbi:HlyD family type I secretion periplasmic adaptor subunit [Yunchengibacter salinarum]|uniref:HlyD family type I secretion periplasmic adaptor subunit n=1 Tax=Yunchengibacter salinarum TaxID=3133399 RepID=UPI0035B5A8CD
MSSQTLPATGDSREVTLGAPTSFKPAELQRWHEGVETSRSGVLRKAKIVAILVFLFGGVWAAVAEVGGAIQVPGRVVAAGNNRVVQHLEGGILDALLVEEGDMVEKGQPVARIDVTQAASQLRSARIRRAILRVQLARRRAEVMGAKTIDFPDDIPEDVLAQRRVQETLESQRGEFRALQEVLQNQVKLIENQIKGERGTIEGQKAVITSLEKQADLFNRELADFQSLLEKGLIRRTQVFATERNLASLEARIAEARLQIERAENNISSLRTEKEKARLERVKEAENVAVEIQKQLNETADVIERLEDRVNRSAMRSPVDGVVFLIEQKSIGAVLRPGDTVMEIFPTHSRLELEVRISPGSIEDVEAGQDVTVKFGRGRTAEPLDGTLTYVSKDSVVDERSQESYFIGRVQVDPNEAEASEHMLPGNMGTVLIKIEPKTFLQVLSGPIGMFTDQAFNE